MKAVQVPLTVSGRLGGIENMRLDTLLLDEAERGIAGARVYDWDGPWITLGRFQSAEKDLIDPTSTPWVIRPTGGKAVLHGHDVTVGLAIPLAHIFEEVEHRGVKPIYRTVVAPLISALKHCGVDAELAEATRYSNRGRHTADCFAFSSPNDIVDRNTGRKICGCALRITETAVLLQASIPNGKPLVDPASVIVNADSSEGSEWDASAFPQALSNALLHVRSVTSA